MVSTIKRNNDVSTGVEKICSHNIEWLLEGKGLQLWDIDIENIKNSLISNNMSGELHTLTPNGNTAWGWWCIQY